MCLYDAAFLAATKNGRNKEVTPGLTSWLLGGGSTVLQSVCIVVVFAPNFALTKYK